MNSYNTKQGALADGYFSSINGVSAGIKANRAEWMEAADGKNMGTKKEKHRKPLISQRFSLLLEWALRDSLRSLPYSRTATPLAFTPGRASPPIGRPCYSARSSPLALPIKKTTLR